MLVVVVSRAVEVPVEASVSPEVVFELVFVAVDVAVVAVVCAVRVSVPVVVVRVIVVVVVWVDTGGATPLSVERASEVLPSTLFALSFEDGERSTPPSQPCASVFVVEAVPPLPAAPASAVPACACAADRDDHSTLAVQSPELAGIERAAARNERRCEATCREKCRLHGQYLTCALNPVAPPATGATVTGWPSK